MNDPFAILEKLAEGVVKLADTDKDITAVLKQMNGMLGEIDKRLATLETKQPAVKHEVFVTTPDGYTFPVNQFNSIRDAYYWILAYFILDPCATSLLHRFNLVTFNPPQEFRGYKIVRCVIK